MCVQSGYKTLTPIQIGNVLSKYDAKEISFRALRVYFACFSLVAIREAAYRVGQKKRRRGVVVPHYRIKELTRLVGSSEREIKSDLRLLELLGLLCFRESQIFITNEILDGAGDVTDQLAGRRSRKRPIPVPRSFLRYFASCTKPALTKTVLGYIVRGLSLSKTTAEVSGKGTVKLSWVSRVFGISERGANYARSELIRIGLISRDTDSYQRKLNRDGAYFVINLSWVNAACENLTDGEISPSDLSSERGPTRETSRAQFAPPRVKYGGEFAPPYKEKKTPYGSKYQKTRATKPHGVSLKQGGEKPSIRNVRGEDLWSFGSVEELYFQAAGEGIVLPAEAMALNFLAAAVRAREADGNQTGIFMGIIRRKLWNHITQAQEDRARAALIKYRAENPDRFRFKEKFNREKVAA